MLKKEVVVTQVKSATSAVRSDRILSTSCRLKIINIKNIKINIKMVHCDVGIKQRLNLLCGFFFL